MNRKTLARMRAVADTHGARYKVHPWAMAVYRPGRVDYVTTVPELLLVLSPPLVPACYKIR